MKGQRLEAVVNLHYVLKGTRCFCYVPNCDCFNVDLPPQSEIALNCHFECTFCRGCATSIR